MKQNSLLEGSEEVNKKLHHLSKVNSKLYRKVLTPTIRAGGTSLARAIRKKAPNKRLRMAVAARVRRRRGQLEAKVGLNVGGKRGTLPQAHLLTLGTQQRHTGTNASRGRIRANDWVHQAVKRGKPAAVKAMQKKLNQRLDSELQKSL